MDTELLTLVNKAIKPLQGWWGQYFLLISAALCFQSKPLVLYKRHFSLKNCPPLLEHMSAVFDSVTHI